MNISVVLGACFAVSGPLLLAMQVGLLDLSNALEVLRAEVDDAFGHDTRIFPDYTVSASITTSVGR